MAVAVSQRAMGNEKVRDLRHFFPIKYSSDPASIESEKVESRRKRQRTTSLDRGPSSSKHAVVSAAPRELRSSSKQVIASTTPCELRSSSKHVVASVTAPEFDNCKTSSSGHVVAITASQGLEGPGPSSKHIISKATLHERGGCSFSGLGGKPNAFEHSKASRFPGSMEPIWPPKEMTRIQPHTEKNIATRSHLPRHTSDFLHGGRKMKYAKVQIPAHEEILRPYVDLTVAKRDVFARSITQNKAKFRPPRRRIMTGLELQNAIWRDVVSGLPRPLNLHGLEEHQDELESPHCSPSTVHAALLRVYQDIPNTLTAFDKFECETQDWVHKYAPKRAEEVLQPGREALILRDWLRGLTISSVENGTGDGSKAQDLAAAGRAEIRVKRKKRKRAEDLDDFLVSSEDDSDQINEFIEVEDVGRDIRLHIPSKRSIVRGSIGRGSLIVNGQKAINAIVISGPHGCGKTAAVFAAAQELGFEVFEINAGNRRSGKDVLDKVGDMTRNHLVNHAQEREGNQDSEELFEPPESLQKDLESGRQATVNSFFKPKTQKIQKAKTQSKKVPKKQLSKQQQNQKQSLILLEEVDVLFEEDKHFWATTLDLLISSKRPIIMTCTDESLLPLDEMLLFAVLRFTTPPEHLAMDYLLLVAGNEGHLLSRSAVSVLLKAKSYDLRASMTELNFFCQMAVGDTKGGLEWMLIRSSPEKTPNEICQAQRVVSDGSYFEGMGCLSPERQGAGLRAKFNDEKELGSNALDYGSMDGANYHCSREFTETTRGNVIHRLKTLDLALDCISAADTFPYSAFRDATMTILDTNSPELEEKSRANFVDGLTLLSAEPLVDHAGINTALALALENCARHLLNSVDPKSSASTLSQHTILPEIADEAENIRSCKQTMRSTLSLALDPIARTLKLPSTLQKGPIISSFDGPTSIIVEDLAPYVRSILAYDLRLEEQRRQLNVSLFQGRREGKMRTTRASRAALEGGNKQHIRRERWFPPETNISMILQSGGKEWQNVLWQSTQQEVEVESRQNADRHMSPAASVTSSDS